MLERDTKGYNEQEMDLEERLKNLKETVENNNSDWKKKKLGGEKE